MGRAKKQKKKTLINSEGWMITFSDLVTLLLTFFVLLLSMATLDRTYLMKAFRTTTIFDEDVGFMAIQSATKVPTKYKIVMSYMENPLDILEKQDRIKDLLFPEEDFPMEFNYSTLEQNLTLLKRPEGVAIVLSDSLLFDTGHYELEPQARFILEKIAELLTATYAPVNIAGYTDTVPGVRISNMELSRRRALSVLEYLLSQGLPPDRFSASGYGPFFPIGDNRTEQGKAQNRRVEILIKTEFGSQSYL
ncbi:MAG: flagellar motor protein MotB [Desulfovibrionales bacterium]